MRAMNLQSCRGPAGHSSVSLGQQHRSLSQASRCCSTRPRQQAATTLNAQQQQPLEAQTQQLLKLEAQQQQCSTSSPGSSTSSSASGRRNMLHMLGAVAVAAAFQGAAVQPTAAAGAAVSSGAALEEYMKLEDQNKLRDQRSLDNIRGKYGIKRSIDGRVQLRRQNGTWMSVRLDMEVPGAILLRDTKTEEVYALETDGLPQVDLSDDYVLFMMFADGQWEKDMTAIEFEEEGGATKQLTMTEKEFHEFVGLLKEPDEPVKKKK